MSGIAVEVENLGKKYILGEKVSYYALRDTLAHMVKHAIRKIFSRKSYDVNTLKKRAFIWALKNVSFTVEKGEVIGIIGRNGAGKTTLLKILARVTEPTEGWAKLYGRTGSLLEIGTGFHYELTGRENIYLNGAILGMKKKEMDEKFDEIVEFAGIEEFLDTPLKRYSIGMQLRLAFSVAAHLEPEILLVDEVLAVGDLEFQKKCLGKMEEVSRGGRTVLFVSHQMNQIRRLCNRVIWLDHGSIRKIGPAHEVVSAYEHAMMKGEESPVTSEGQHTRGRFIQWEIVEPRGESPHVLSEFGPVVIRFVIRVQTPVRNGFHTVRLYSPDGHIVWGSGQRNIELEPGIYEFIYHLPYLPLRPGAYTWRVLLVSDYELYDEWECVPHLIIATSPASHIFDMWTGILNIPYEFRIQERKETAKS